MLHYVSHPKDRLRVSGERPTVPGRERLWRQKPLFRYQVVMIRFLVSRGPAKGAGPYG
jgi:hypothetical protein